MNYSFSAISSFKSCPKSFEFKYVKRIPEAFQTIERHMGSCIHETLNWLYEERMKNMNPTLNQVKEKFDMMWNVKELETARVIKQNTSLDDYYNDGTEQVTHFYKNVFLEDKSQSLYLEQKFEILLEANVKYVGIIDRVARQLGGIIRITDFKTGKVNHPLDDLQLPSYALYIFSNFKEEIIELCFEDLRSQRTVVTRFEIAEEKRVRSDLLQEITIMKKTELFDPKPSVLCQWCGFNNICENPHDSVRRVLLGVDQKPIENPVEADEDEQKFCPECGGILKKRKGKFGPFWGCVHYPDCRYTLDIKEVTASQSSMLDEKEICPECGGRLKERKGKFGPFMGCSNFPDCRFTRKIDKSG